MVDKRRFAVRRRVRFSAVRAAGANGAEARLEGHDYTLYVTVEGPAPPETGMVIDLKALSELLRAEVVAELDRGRIEQAELMAGLPATAENLTLAIWRRVAPRLPAGRLTEIELWEGPEKCVRYRGE